MALRLPCLTVSEGSREVRVRLQSTVWSDLQPGTFMTAGSVVSVFTVHPGVRVRRLADIMDHSFPPACNQDALKRRDLVTRMH